MKNFFLPNKVFFVFLLGLLIIPTSLFAYTDQVTVKVDEAWIAVQEVLKPGGIKHLDPQNREIETAWVIDTVKRSRGLLKGIASQTYERRYKLKVKVTERAYDTEISIRGVFQERPYEFNSRLMMWKKVKVNSEDLEIERVTFMRILNRLELSRKGISDPY